MAIPSTTPGTSAFRTQKILSLYNILQSDLFVIPTLFNTANSRLLILMCLLYHNDTIIKKEKELLRALLSQFCKLEFI